MGNFIVERQSNNNLGIGATIPLPDIVISGDTFTFPAVTGTITNYGWNTAGNELRAYQWNTLFSASYDIPGFYSPHSFIAQASHAINLPSVSMGWASSSWNHTEGSSIVLNTSTYFNSNNPTTKSLPISMSFSWSIKAGNEWDPISAGGSGTASGSASLTLNAPPYFNNTPSLSKNTSSGYYRNTTTVTVSSSAIAKYGGYISTTKLQIGSQTASISGNGSLSIKLNTVGTFTPVVTVTDSRGQSTSVSLSAITVSSETPTSFDYTQPVSSLTDFWTDKATASITISDLTVPYDGTATAKFTIGSQSVTRNNDGILSITPTIAGTFTPTLVVTDSFGRVYSETLNQITIRQYVAPNISFQLYRAMNITVGGVTKYGIKDDEATTHTLIESGITYTNAIANLIEPTVSVDGVVTSNITWYRTYSETDGLSNPVNWTNYNPTSPVTLYALISGTFNLEDFYPIGITTKDSLGGESINIIQTLSPGFFTIDFLAGGHGVALGQPCKTEGFYCAMSSHFNDFSGVMRSIFNLMHPKGSYYETNLTYNIPSGSAVPTPIDLEALGETWFDPNYAWGGTWILETAGQVHVSAGTGYAVNGANNNVSDGGETEHRLTGAESGVKSHTHTINHGHGFTQPTVNGGSHTHPGFWERDIYLHTGTAYAMVSWNTGGARSTTGADGGHTHSVSGGAVTDHAGSSGGTTAADATTAHNNMQPYINVYRWHRTA